MHMNHKVCAGVIVESCALLPHSWVWLKYRLRGSDCLQALREAPSAGADKELTVHLPSCYYVTHSPQSRIVGLREQGRWWPPLLVQCVIQVLSVK